LEGNYRSYSSWKETRGATVVKKRTRGATVVGRELEEL